MIKFTFTLLYFFILFSININYPLAHISPTRPCPPGTKPLPATPTDNDYPHIQTAIGCLDTTPERLTSIIITIAIGVAGGLAFLFLVSGAFKLITSGGDPDNIQAAKERITSALAGLLLIVFSVVILQIVGIQVLGLPGFTGSGRSTLTVPGP